MELLLKRYFRWTMLVVVLIVVGAGYSLLLSAKISSIQTVAVSEKKQAETNLKSQKALRESLTASLQKYSKIFTPQALEKINAVLPQSAEFPSILLTVQNIAASVGYNLDSLSVSAVAAGGSVVSPDTSSSTPGIVGQINSIPKLSAYDLSINLTGSGGYTDFKTMINAFEESQQLFDVLSLNYSAGATTGATPNASPSYALTVRTYIYGDKTP